MIYKGLELDHLGQYIDVSTVKTDCAIQEIDEMIEIVAKHNCICASPMPWATEYTIGKLKSVTGTVVTGVVGFPSGAETTSAKVRTARELIALGCRELDMVINVAALKSGMYEYVKSDVKAVIDAAAGIPVKTILEVCYLDDELITRASNLCVEAGASYIKTGTGWGPSPTTVEHIKLIRKTIGSAAKIKAAGGVRSLDTLLSMYAEGCNRFGIGVRTVRDIFQEVQRLESSCV
ncbi:deoxyribose-phosphate aldolase [Clostridium sp. AF18-27]|uniref:deoxyribose-phosphate aldolase n=1 Tax=Enterocloster lavalensis TaxID=460384 RepID=UPI000E4AA3A2|nr:deoxyribose-phosphate aldolase [Enterocloster lavalensis]RHR57119.1 deoxyribose-phosphate aldolase [Clostridium sp. AF18-27]